MRSNPPTTRYRAGLKIAAIVAAAGLALPALAQPAPAIPGEPEITRPDRSNAGLGALIERQLKAEFLTEDERKDLRIGFGRFTAADLDTPARRSRAALLLGVLDDESLTDPAAPAEDRAEAARRRGETEQALAILMNANSMRAHRVRVEALYDLGRFDDAVAACEPIIAKLANERTTDADVLIDGVEALIIRARIKGSAQSDGGDYRTLISLIARARDELAPLNYRVRLAEAKLLYEKHNRTEAADAATEALARNPGCSEALAMLGRLAVDGLNGDGVEAAAQNATGLIGEEGPAAGVFAAALQAISVPAQLNRARMSIRQGLAQQAIDDLKPVLDLFPAQRQALALRAAAVALTYDEQALDDAISAFDAVSPGSPMARYEVGAALAEARQYTLAPAHLLSVIERMPSWSAPRIDLGLMYLQDARDELAAEQLDAAITLDPFNRRARNSARLAELVAAMPRFETEHFEIRYEPGIDELLARELPPILEQIHERVAGPTGLDHEPSRKTVIELMPTHERFAVRITGEADLHTMAAATGPLIAFESPRVGGTLMVGPYDWRRVMQHEYTHTVSLSRTVNRLPHWFTEACAVYHEDAPRDESTWNLLLKAFNTGTLFDLEEINLAFSRPKLPTDRAQAYAQGHWMYQFIADRWGDRMPLELMDAYAVGEPEAEAFERLLGLNETDFLDEFSDWARNDLRAQGLLPPEGEPSATGLVEGLADDEVLSAALAQSWLETYPGHPEVLEILVGLTLRSQGDVIDGETARLLETFAEARPVAELPHRLLARHYLETGRPDEAIEHLEFLDVRSSYEPAFAASLAELYAQRRDHGPATAKAERATQISPFDPRLRELAARVAISTERLGDARRHIEALILLEPDRQQHHRRLEAIGLMMDDS